MKEIWGEGMITVMGHASVSLPCIPVIDEAFAFNASKAGDANCRPSILSCLSLMSVRVTMIVNVYVSGDANKSQEVNLS